MTQIQATPHILAQAALGPAVTSKRPEDSSASLSQDKSFAADQVRIQRQKNIFGATAGAVAAGGALINMGVWGKLGAQVGGVKGAYAGALLGGLASSALVGATLGTVDERIFEPKAAVLAGGAAAGAALGLRGGIQGVAVGTALGLGASLIALKAGR